VLLALIGYGLVMACFGLMVYEPLNEVPSPLAIRPAHPLTL
jgi:hypothetical protein